MLKMRFWFVIVMSFILHNFTAQAADVIDTMEKALMPGELAEAHAEFEEDCTDCHLFFRQSMQNDKCLDCHDHENVKDDIEQEKGYHGRIPGVKEKECRVCHREHVGRNADIVMLDKQTFDHNATDFVLRGGHLEVQCQACHEEDKEYHEAKHKCFDCHEENEPHKGKLGKVCNSCHRESAWNDFQFDHDKTDFKLKGKHKGVECRDCHPQERYLSVPTKCYACHKGDDKHELRYGKKCKECHSPQGWAEQSFDHDEDTKFKLTGMHKKVGCDQCHAENTNAYDDKRKKNCYTCHRFSDEHKGQFGKKCEECHTTKAWVKPKFDHDETDFPLKGKHEDAICKDCHPGEIQEDISTKCFDCHQQDDVHEGNQGKLCNDCHNVEGWRTDVEFDHDITNFPLLGSHAALACEECHGSTNFKETKFACYSCHKEDDEHKRQLSEECGVCHISNDFKSWDFDHDEQTDFDLKGSHKGIDCRVCHTEPVKLIEDIELPDICFGCHAGDDAHNGGFGRNCERCHIEKSFQEVDMNSL